MRIDVKASTNSTAYDVTGAWILSLVDPPTGLVLTPEPLTNARMKLEWTNAAGVNHCGIYLKVGTEWELVGETVSAGTEIFYDYTCPCGDDVEYAVVNVDDDGYMSNPDVCTETAAMGYEDWWISNNDDTDLLLQLHGVVSAPFDEIDDKVTWYPLGRNAALVEEGEKRGLKVSLQCTFYPEPYAAPIITADEQLDLLRANRATTYSIWLKDNMGRRWRVSISEIKATPLPGALVAYDVSFVAEEVG
jgi:hypothetical protein